MSEKCIPLSIPVLGGREWKYVKDCLDSGWISSVGEYVARFESDVCRLTGAKHAVACINGTAALHIALLVAGVKQGDEVIVPTLTFIASVNAVHYAGASPVFMDCEEFYNIDPVKTMEFIQKQTVLRRGASYNRKTGQRVAALMAVHVFGNAVDMTELLSLCKARNIFIIEDAAESMGTYYKSGPLAGRYTGTIGGVGCFSFNGNKIISTGGGGMIVTNDAALARRAKYLTTQAKEEGPHYIHNEIGFNYRLTNIQAAIGVAQLELLPKYLRVKAQNFKRYQKEVTGIPGIRLAQPPAYAQCNHWLYALEIDEKQYGLNKDELMDRFRGKNIEARPVWGLNHTQKPYRRCQTYKIEQAPKMVARTLNIPSPINLTPRDITTVADWLKKWRR